MKSKYLSLSFATNVVLSLIAGVGVLAQDRPPQRLSGLINDYTPSNVAGGPYEMRGKWSLRLHHES
jgi:hypothetical protein